jgi:hypothetical protein
MLLTRHYGSFVKPAWTKCRSNAKAVRMPSFCMTRKEMQSVRELIAITGHGHPVGVGPHINPGGIEIHLL